MEESKALQKLLEIADLVGMIEEMMNPASTDRLSPASWSGMRITLRNVRDMVQQSHATLATDLVHRSRAAVQAAQTVPAAAPAPSTPAVVPAPVELSNRTLAVEEKAIHSVRADTPVLSRPITASDSARSQISRRDLKASLEKVLDR